MNTRDKGFCLRSHRADADGVGLSRNSFVANINVVTSRGEIGAGRTPNCDIG